MKRNQVTAALLALLLFVTGFAAGALAHRFYRDSVVSAKTTAEDARHQYVSEMRTRLHLTADQIGQLEAILDQTKAKARAVREHYHPEMARIKEEQVAQVKAILRPDQVPEYERLVAEHERRYHQAEERDRRTEQHPAKPSPGSEPASAPAR